MNTRSAARELAFLSIGNISQSAEISADKLILAATRTLKDLSKTQLKDVQKDLRTLGEFFFNQSLEDQMNESMMLPVASKELHQHICQLEMVAFALKESLDLPELLNQNQQAYDYAAWLVDLFRKNKAQTNLVLDKVLQKDKEKKNWTAKRILLTDRYILKVATTELTFQKDCPVPVIINEFVRLAGKYGIDDSPKFINGVLVDIAKEVRPA